MPVRPDIRLLILRVYLGASGFRHHYTFAPNLKSQNQVWGTGIKPTLEKD